MDGDLWDIVSTARLAAFKLLVQGATLHKRLTSGSIPRQPSTIAVISFRCILTGQCGA